MPELDNPCSPGPSGPPTAFAAEAAPSPAIERWHKPVLLLFLLVFAVNVALLLLQGSRAPEKAADVWHGLGRWPEGMMVGLAVATTLLALARRLPLQNVVTAATLIAVISAMILIVGAWSGIPFGPVFFSDRAGDKLFGLLPWALPLGWVVILINARGVARLMLRPWRKTRFYGFWVIGLTALLAVELDLALEPFAVYAREFWLWKTPGRVAAWYTAPWVNFIGWYVVSAAILVFTVPWLINKRPVKRPKDYHPLVLWVLLNGWMITGNAAQRLWPAVLVAAAGCALAVTFAVRGARWSS